MKKLGAWTMKAIVAGLIALVLLYAFSMLYYNVPVHYDNESGATEYKWETSTFYSKGTEGFALGKTNNDGHNNLKDYYPGDKIDILLMGSSHMEGFNVSQEESANEQLNKLFMGEKYVYNIGTAGHTLMYCISNLADALDAYRPAEYVLIETCDLSFSQAELQSVLDGSIVHLESHNEGLVGLLQKMPYLRLLYTKFFNSGDEAFGAVDTGETPDAASAETLEEVLSIVVLESRKHSVQPVIAYIPPVTVDMEGHAVIGTDDVELKVFSDTCDRLGIVFVDMAELFIEEYETEHRLPYGFTNTAPGEGHINSTGQRLFAQGVYEAIMEREGRR